MGKELNTLLLAGALTAAAATAFADNRANAQTAPKRDNAATTRPAAKDPQQPVTAMSKDGKPLSVSIDVPVLNSGNYDKAKFQAALQPSIMLTAMTVFTQYNEADIPKNIPKIQQQITEALGKNVIMGASPDGKMQTAKAGTNYGNATITRVAEANGGKVIFEQKAPATKPAATQPKPKPKA
jgi:hypothetical protein